jgi:hypothetical protein
MQSFAIPQLYGIWRTQLLQQIPDSCETRLTNMLYLMMGVFQAQTVQLTLMARKLPIRAKKLSIVKRLTRFVDNTAVDVRQWYHPTAQWLLSSAASGGQVHLLIDSTKVSGHYRKVMVSVAYHRRSLPIAWFWDAGSRGHCTTKAQIRLLEYVQTLLPKGIAVSLAGDCEFGNPLLIEYLDFWGWDYALRQPKDTLIMMKGSRTWQRLDRFHLLANHILWIGHVVLTAASAYPTNVVLFWQKGEKEPWYLATNVLSGQAALRLYRRRMWIEEMYGDMKGHGFDLEISRLQHADRLSRLTLAVCLLYVWLVAIGEYVLDNGYADEVDRTDRRDLSIFRLGWDFLERRLALYDPLPTIFRPNFCLVSGR